MIKEIALADLATMKAAIAAGVDRVELNDRLDLGGVTPSLATVKQAVQMAADANVDLVVMIRPRGGDFHYSRAEVETMRCSLKEMRAAGVKLVTFGALDEKKHLDRDTMVRLLEAAQPMHVVFHMAFDDMVPELQPISMQWLADHGVVRILTHGGPLTTPIANLLPVLQSTIANAPAGLTILPGGGVTYENAEMIADTLGVTELHGSKIVQLS